jgi:glyoxylase-like metal-dependent hydrolase (beta-lactamase superfamily II)
VNIYTLDLNFQNLPQTVGAYLVVGPEGPLLVESGPASTLETLQARLAEHGYAPADVRHVLLTHIHLDHAGAASWWARQGAQVYVHHVGAPHLIDPARLLSSAQRIYGETMDTLWGQTLPVPAGQVHPVHDGDTIRAGGLTFTALDTPGHARHHLVFRVGKVAFTGDAAGVHLPGSNLVSLPTPPPEFDLEAWQKTVARLLDENLATLYPTHFGPIENARAHLEAVSELLDQSAAFVRDRMQAGHEREALIQQFSAWNRERAQAHGLSERDLGRYELANPTFMSVDGLMRYWHKRGIA